MVQHPPRSSTTRPRPSPSINPSLSPSPSSSPNPELRRRTASSSRQQSRSRTRHPQRRRDHQHKEQQQGSASASESKTTSVMDAIRQLVERAQQRAGYVPIPGPDPELDHAATSISGSRAITPIQTAIQACAKPARRAVKVSAAGILAVMLGFLAFASRHVYSITTQLC